jgi:hypothetical protein
LWLVRRGWYLAPDRTTYPRSAGGGEQDLITMTPFSNALMSGGGVNRRRPVLLAL